MLADNRLRIWDVATAGVRKEIELPARRPPLRDGPSGRSEAGRHGVRRGRTRLHRLHVCDVASGERLFSADGLGPGLQPRRPLAGRRRRGREDRLLLLDAETHETAARFRGHEELDPLGRLQSRRPPARLVQSDRTVRLWQIDSGACQVLRGHTDEVFAVAFHPDGTRLASAGRDRAVWLWDLARGEEVARLQGHTSYVWSLAFSPDGATLASGSGDFTVRLWDTAPLKTALPGPPRGRGPATRGRTAGREVVAAEERPGRGRGSAAGRPAR